VEIDNWGGSMTLEASVTRVEREAITKISALGVEEQRVPVRADITSPESDWSALGSGYRVLARFILWEGAGVLQVPTAALFRPAAVRPGRQGGRPPQVLEGLAEGDVVVVHPPRGLEDGTRVEITADIGD